MKPGGKNIRKTTCTVIDSYILIDFGPDILSHVHNHRLSLADLDAIIITHSHEDHFYTGDMNLAHSPFSYFERNGKIMVYGSRKVHGMFEAGIAEGNAYRFAEVQPFVPFTLGEYTIHPMLAEYGDADEDCFIYCIESEGKTFLLGNDTNIFPAATWEYLKGLKFEAVALDTTTGVNPPKPPGKSGHMDITAVRSVRERMIKMGCADQNTVFVMNHFSHNGGLIAPRIKGDRKRDGIIPAYDGYVLEI